MKTHPPLATSQSLLLCHFRRVLFLLLIAAMMAPLIEAFDSWDKAGLTNDTEFQIATLAMVAGLFAVVAFVATRLRFTFGHLADLGLQVKDGMIRGAVPSSIFHGSSPPGVPLRI